MDNVPSGKTDQHMEHDLSLVHLFILLGLILLGHTHSYLFFHVLSEGFSIAVACGIFIVAWHARRFIDNPFFVFAGVAYLFIGFLDFCHTITYQDMGIFLRVNSTINPGADPAIEFWIAARYMEGISLLLACFYINRKLNPERLFLIYTLVTLFIFAAIYEWGIFPTCFVRDPFLHGGEAGLTTFKVASEYIVGVIIMAAMYMLVRQRRHFAPNVLRLLLFSMALTVIAEMVFTLYTGMFGEANILGHYLKISSFFLVYMATLRTGLQDPYAILFHNLHESRQELHKERDFIQAVLDTEGAVVVLLDFEGRVVRFNRAAEITSGLNSDQVIGRIYRELLLPERGYDNFEEKFSACKDGGKDTSIQSECEWQTTDGQIRQMAMSYSLILGDDAEENFVVLSGIDVTERRQAVETLIQASRQAAVGDLAAGVAHQFNNLNAGVQGYAEMIAMDPDLSEKSRLRLDKLIAAMKRSTKLIERLLAFARKSGEVEDNVGLDVIVDDVFFILEAALNKDGIRCRIKTDNAPSIRGNKVILEEALMNILTNARHAMLFEKEKTLTITTGEEEGYAFLKVKDTGCGIPPENKERIFNPMFSTKGEFAPPGSPMENLRGAGLGLSIASNIVEDHGGSIEVESEPGQGTTVTIWLPL